MNLEKNLQNDYNFADLGDLSYILLPLSISAKSSSAEWGCHNRQERWSGAFTKCLRQ